MRMLRMASGLVAIVLAAFCGLPAHAFPQGSLLEQARAEAAAGRLDRAGELYRQILQAQPDNPEALGGYVDALVAQGRWRNALGSLEHLVELQPKNASRLFQLGRMESWQEGDRDRALADLKRAAELEPDNADYQVGYAEVLGWSSAGRPEATRILRGVLASHPNQIAARRLQARLLASQSQPEAARAVLEPLLRRPDAQAEDFWTLGQVEEASGNMPAAADAYRQVLERDPSHLKSIERLAEISSWHDTTRAEAARLFQQGLKLAPNDENLLVPYAEMLSWERATRPRAMEYFQKALAEDPNNRRAMDGEAQLLAWSGRSSEALALYEKVLAKDPNDVAALRGKAQILNWEGRYGRALDILSLAHRESPEDPNTMVELARANYELGHYSEARANLAQAAGVTGPDVEALRREINHALGAYFELGYGLRRDGLRLDEDSLEALVSTALGTSSRLSLLYQPALYRTFQRNFNSNYYDLALDSQPSEKVTTHFDVAGRTFPGTNSQIEGSFDLAYRVEPSFKLTVGFARQAVQESLVSTLGAETGGVFVGQVESNLATLGGSYTNSAHHFDASLNYTDGVYTGENLASNRRWSVDGEIGKSLHSDHPYFRIAYGFTYLRFDHDADFEPGTAPARVTGGYYSPTRYLLNYGSLFFSYNFGHRVKWDAGGRVGAQNAETTFTSFSNARFASTFTTHFTWSATENNEFRLTYDFLDVFNTFNRHLFFVTWRRYF